MALLGSVKLCIHCIPIQLSSPKLGQMGYMGWTPVGLSLVHTQSQMHLSNLPLRKGLFLQHHGLKFSTYYEYSGDAHLFAVQLYRQVTNKNGLSAVRLQTFILKWIVQIKDSIASEGTKFPSRCSEQKRRMDASMHDRRNEFVGIPWYVLQTYNYMSRTGENYCFIFVCQAELPLQ